MKHLFGFALLLVTAGASAADAQRGGFAERLAGAAFTAMEQQMIEEYYRAVPGTGRDAPIGRERDSGYPRHDDDRAGNGKGKSKDKDKDKGKKSGKGKGSGLPPGLAKRDALPPGLQKQLEKNGRLPPGLDKRALPNDLERRLPRRMTGMERVVVDRDVVLVETATGIVLDILRDVVGGN